VSGMPGAVPRGSGVFALRRGFGAVDDSGGESVEIAGSGAGGDGGRAIRKGVRVSGQGAGSAADGGGRGAVGGKRIPERGGRPMESRIGHYSRVRTQDWTTWKRSRNVRACGCKWSSAQVSVRRSRKNGSWMPVFCAKLWRTHSCVQRSHSCERASSLTRLVAAAFLTISWRQNGWPVNGPSTAVFRFYHLRPAGMCFSARRREANYGPLRWPTRRRLRGCLNLRTAVDGL
jgi:hypothetical protein